MVEVLCYAGVPYGFGFIQYIFEQEGVFWEELCYDEELHAGLCEMQVRSGVQLNLHLFSADVIHHAADIQRSTQQIRPFCDSFALCQLHNRWTYPSLLL